ncbi:MAG: cytidylyltransferase domain-containing protein, partial [Planctomycetota bacterium]
MSSGAGALLVIPARLHSTRLPRKALLSETGKPLIQHVWEAAAQVRRADAAIVATD